MPELRVSILHSGSGAAAGHERLAGGRWSGAHPAASPTTAPRVAVKWAGDGIQCPVNRRYSRQAGRQGVRSLEPKTPDARRDESP